MELGVLNLLNPRPSALALSSQGHPGPEGWPLTLASTAATHTERGGAWRAPAGEPAPEPCGLGAAGGPPILLGSVFARCNCTFPRGTSCSAGGADCTPCPPGEAHGTLTSTSPCLACWQVGTSHCC